MRRLGRQPSSGLLSCGMRGVLALLLGFILCSCNSTNPCGPFDFNTAILFDVSGASNSACTLTFEGNGHSVSFDIPAPSPPVASTAPDSRAALTGCLPLLDAGAAGESVTPTPEFPDITVWRSSTALCFVSQGTVFHDLYPTSDTSTCSATVTLTCGNQALYDHRSTAICKIVC
jgi:hypothetical protein